MHVGFLSGVSKLGFVENYGLFKSFKFYFLVRTDLSFIWLYHLIIASNHVHGQFFGYVQRGEVLPRHRNHILAFPHLIQYFEGHEFLCRLQKMPVPMSKFWIWDLYEVNLFVFCIHELLILSLLKFHGLHNILKQQLLFLIHLKRIFLYWYFVQNRPLKHMDLNSISNYIKPFPKVRFS